MADITRASYAFAGSGEVDDGNAAALLDDLLPQALGAVYRPKRVPRSNKSLSAVIDWLESKDVLGQHGTVPSEDLIGEMLTRREVGDDVTLVVIWPEEPGEDELALAKSAFENDIPVKNLAKALDDLLQDDVFPPEPAPEAAAETVPVPDGDIQDDLVQATIGAFDGVAAQLAQNMVGTLELFIRRVVRDEMAKINGSGAPAAAPAKAPARGRRPAGPSTEIEDGPAKPPAAKFSDGGKATDSTPTIKYYMNQDGQYRVAKTRPRKGEEPVELTAAQVKQLQDQGLITG